MKEVSLTKISTRHIDENDSKNDENNPKNKEIIDKVNQLTLSGFKEFIYHNYLIPRARDYEKSCRLIIYKQYFQVKDYLAVYLPDFSQVLNNPTAYKYFVNYKLKEYFNYIEKDPDIQFINFKNIKHNYYPEDSLLAYPHEPAIQIDIKWK